MKKVITLLLAALTSSLSAQTFIAGWDFDNVGIADTSDFANWGVQAGFATASWTHDPASPPIVFTSEFGFSGDFNDTSANDVFSFGTDSITGFDQFSDGPGATPSEYGFQSLSNNDVFSLSFDGTNYENLELEYAYSSTGNSANYTLISVDLDSLNGLANATYDFTPTSDGLYDNFAISGTVVPEPSTYAAIFGVIALVFVAYRRRK